MSRAQFHLALIRRHGSLYLEPTPTMRPGPGGLLIALSHVGICGTDLQILNGTRPDTAEILGHEGVGAVVEAGHGAVLRAGDRVVFNPVAELCDGNILGHNVSGLFQEYISLGPRAVARGLVLPMENGTPFACEALVEPLGAVIYGYELISRATSHLRTAVVFGAGPVGTLAAVFLRTLGIRALLVHRSAIRLETIRNLQIIPAADLVLVSENLPARILAITDGRGTDAALICTTRAGAPDALRKAAHIVSNGGCIDLVTNYPENAPVPSGTSNEAVRGVRAANVCGLPKEGAYLHATAGGRSICITGHRGTSTGHLTRALYELKTRGPLYAKLITHVLPLSEAANAIQTLAHSAERFLAGRDCIKAVIDLTMPHARSRTPVPGMTPVCLPE